MDDLRKLLKDLSIGFQERSIARELTDKLLDANPVGEILISAECWAEEWGVTLSSIWLVIDLFESKSYWNVVQDGSGSKLQSGGIASAAKAISRKKKRNVLEAVKSASHIDRANDLRLDSTNPSAISEVVEKIPAAERNFALNRGYAGWLPSSGFGIDGMVYRPDEGMKAKLSAELPSLDVEMCFSEMFDDLKTNYKIRPTMTAFPYWIFQWVKKNSERLAFVRSESEKNDLISAKMDDY